MKEVSTLDLTNVFLKAFDFHPYAWIDYLAQQQASSGWSKNTFIQALVDVHETILIKMRIGWSAGDQKRNPIPSDHPFPLANFMTTDTADTITRQQIDSLLYAITGWRYHTKEKKSHSSFETLTFTEFSLSFILREFKIQAGVVPAPIFREKGVCLRHKICFSEPLFDFLAFKAAFRELLLTSNNTTELRNLLRKYETAAKEIVSLYNEEIFILEDRAIAGSASAIEKEQLIRFNERLSQSTWNDESQFRWLPHVVFTNRDFADYAVKIANLLGSELHSRKKAEVGVVEKNFLADFISGVYSLQDVGRDEHCYVNILQQKFDEKGFRDYYYRWFMSKGYDCEREALRNGKFIDLKISHKLLSDKIIEFKGWWNPRKKTLLTQICHYLTDFDGIGYVFMINHKNAPIDIDYKELVIHPATKFVAGSWREHDDERHDFKYYSSNHQLGAKEKLIYHFIFNVK